MKCRAALKSVSRVLSPPWVLLPPLALCHIFVPSAARRLVPGSIFVHSIFAQCPNVASGFLSSSGAIFVVLEREDEQEGVEGREGVMEEGRGEGREEVMMLILVLR